MNSRKLMDISLPFLLWMFLLSTILFWCMKPCWLLFMVWIFPFVRTASHTILPVNTYIPYTVLLHLYQSVV